MKKISLIILAIGSLITFVSMAILSLSVRKDEQGKEKPMSTQRQAREDLKRLRPVADSLGINHYGMSAKELKEAIELAQSTIVSEEPENLEDGDESENEGNDTEEIKSLD